jgi:hypothetical protein
MSLVRIFLFSFLKKMLFAIRMRSNSVTKSRGRPSRKYVVIEQKTKTKSMEQNTQVLLWVEGLKESSHA